MFRAYLWCIFQTTSIMRGWLFYLYFYKKKQKNKKNKDANGCAGKHAVISFSYFRLGAVYKYRFLVVYPSSYIQSNHSRSINRGLLFDWSKLTNYLKTKKQLKRIHIFTLWFMKWFSLSWIITHLSLHDFFLKKRRRCDKWEWTGHDGISSYFLTMSNLKKKKWNENLMDALVFTWNVNTPDVATIISISSTEWWQ